MSNPSIPYYNLENCVYYKNNLGYHRLDGPAVEWHTGRLAGYKVWYINDVVIGCNNLEYSKAFPTRFIKNNEEFLKFMKLKIFW